MTETWLTKVSNPFPNLPQTLRNKLNVYTISFFITYNTVIVIDQNQRNKR